LNIDNRILAEGKLSNSPSKKATKLDRKIYELIINDINNLIALSKNYLEKYVSKITSSITSPSESNKNFIKLKINGKEANDFKSPVINKKVKFFLDDDKLELEQNSLDYLNNKFLVFKKEMDNIKVLMQRKSDLDL